MKQVRHAMKLFLLSAILFSCSLFAKETFVFSLHSYHEAYPWTREQRTGLRDVVNNVPNLYPLYSAEYLDTKRRSFDQAYEDEVVHYLRSKYKGYRPDVIYVTDDNALKFMIDNREKLFPKVPVVYSGINNQSVIDTLPKETYTGIHEEKEVIPNLKLIQKLFPTEPDVLVLGDGSSTADVILADIKQHDSTIKGMNIRYLNTPSLEVILEELKAYKGKNIILSTIGGFRFANGNLVPLKEAIHEIVHSGDFHIFSMEDTCIQQGVLGGHADDGSIQGREAGKILVGIITHPELPLPQKLDDLNRWIFDVQALHQHNIRLPDDIAAQSHFINRPRSFYQKHEEFITGLLYTLSVTIILGSFLFIGYLYRSRKIIAQHEGELMSITKSFNKAQKLANIGNWVWDLKANTLWWSDEIYHIFGLRRQAFNPSYETFLQQVHPDDRETVQSAVNDAIAHHTGYSMVHRIIKADGTIRRVHEEGSIDYEEGAPLKMNGTVHDITEAFEKEEALLLQAQIFDAVQDSIIVHDLEGKFFYLNENAWKTRGYTHEEMMEMKITDLDANCNFDKMKSMMNQMQKVGYVKTKTGHLCKNGERLPVEVYAKLIRLNNRQYVLSSIQDIKEQLAVQEEISKLSKVVEQIDDEVMITDKKGIITYVNQAFCVQTGYSKEEVLGNSPSILKSGEHDQTFYHNLWKIILHGHVFRITMVNRKKNGDLFYENKTITPLKDDKENIIAFVSSGKDVTLEKKMHLEMERVATIDKLTGIYNRHKFEELYVLESERARRFSQPLSLIMIDIDHFKSVNDTYGHDIGDEVLKHLAKIVQDTIRQIDIFARWGGEEFLVLSPNTDLKSIQVVAEKLRLAIAEAEFPEVSHITVSQGISTFEAEDTFKRLFKRADMGLYHAKEHGRNQVGVITS